MLGAPDAAVVPVDLPIAVEDSLITEPEIILSVCVNEVQELCGIRHLALVVGQLMGRKGRSFLTFWLTQPFLTDLAQWGSAPKVWPCPELPTSE